MWCNSGTGDGKTEQSKVQRQSADQGYYKNNMVPANIPDPEANPEDINITIEDIEEDTGLTQQPMMVNPAPPPEEVPGTDYHDTDPSPWSDEDEVSNPEYPEQPDDPDENPWSSSQAVSNTANELDVSQSQHDDPEVTNDTGYPDSQEINTGSLQNPDPTKSSDTGQDLNKWSSRV